MTPDDVVARAKELVGKEVDVTIRGVVVQYASDSPGHHFGVERSGSGCFAVSLTRYGESAADLVSIERAPLRIKVGQLYIDDNGKLWRGGPERIDRPNGLLWSFGRNSTWDYEPSRMPGLRAVKVVDA